jgi:hypothetical protein
MDTDDLDLVRDPPARAQVIGRVRSALTGAGRQLPLPALGIPPEDADSSHELSRRLLDLQQFHRALDRMNGASDDVFFDYLALSQGIGRLGEALKQVWLRQDELLARVGNRREAHDLAVEAHVSSLQDTLADALDLLLKIANDSGVNLESAYVDKLERIAGEKGATAL